MTDDTQPEALRALAEAAKWTGKWYDAGCNTVYCTYDKEDSILHDEIAHPVPFGVSGYIAAAHPQAVIALLDRIAELEAQIEALSGVQALSAAPAPAIGDELRDTLVAVSAAIAERDDRAAQKMICEILAASTTPPAEQQAEESHIKLLAECRDAFAIPEPGSPLEVQWAAAMARPEEVPEYVRACVAAMQAAPKAEPVKACVCGEPQASGTVHRVDGPCYVAAPQQAAQEPTQEMVDAVMSLVDLETSDPEDHRYDDGSKLAAQICRAVLALAPQQAAPKAAPGEQDLASIEQEIAETCMNTPPGWRCTRKAGHDGPCAAVSCPEDLEFVAKGMKRLRGAEAAPQQEAQEPYAYAVYFPDQPKVELVHDLDELIDDLTNRPHVVTKLNAAPQTAPVPTSATGGDWTQPTTVALRLGDAMQLLCGGKRPTDDMVQQWLDNTSESLQEFAASNGPAWAQGIGLIDAALVMVDQPTEITAIDNPDRDHEHRAAYATASSQPAPAPLSGDTERLREALQRIEGASMSMYATRSDMLEHCQDIARAALAAQGGKV